LSLLAGLSVALAARQQIRRGAMQWREPYLPGLLVFELLVLLPLGGYFFYSHPFWSTLYFYQSLESSSWIGVGMLLGSLIAAVAGYQIGHVLCRRRQDRAPTLSFVIPVVLAGWIFLLVLFELEGRKILRSRIGTVRSDASFPSLPPQTPSIPSPVASHEIPASLTSGSPSVKDISGKSASKDDAPNT